MTLPFPWIVYGIVKDSTGSTIEGVTVAAVGDTYTSGVTDSIGRYIINLQNYATDGITVTVTCAYQGESISTTFTLKVEEPGKRLDLTLLIVSRVPRPTAAVGNPLMF